MPSDGDDSQTTLDEWVSEPATDSQPDGPPDDPDDVSHEELVDCVRVNQRGLKLALEELGQIEEMVGYDGVAPTQGESGDPEKDRPGWGFE